MRLPVEPAYKRLLKDLVYGLASRHSAGPRDASEGVEICRALGRQGLASTLGQFGRVGDDPLRTTREYRLASAQLADGRSSVTHYLSLKPPVLRFDLQLSTAIASTALSNGQGVLFDSHGHHLADSTLHLLDQVMRQGLPEHNGELGWSFGLVLPARWKRSLDDAGWVAERGVRARLVKGEFGAGGARDEVNPREGFLALVDRLAGKVPELAVATHDRGLAREAIRRCTEAGTMVELELLFGIPAPDMIALARELEVPTRYYVPFGDALLIYGIRHFMTHPHKLLRPGASELVEGHGAKLARIIELSRTGVTARRSA